MYHHLTQKQRYYISLRKERGDSHAQIAEFICVDKSTISRELKRNKTSQGKYESAFADQKAKERRRSASQKPSVLTSEMKAVVIELLTLGWSPEQISGRLKIEKKQVSYETIYRWIRKDKKENGQIFKMLRHRGKKYTKQTLEPGSVWGIPDRIGIENRPEEIDLKARLGDWEIDTIIGKNHKSALLTIADRKSKYTVIEKLEGKNKKSVNKHASRRLKLLPCLSITADNGREFAGHKALSKKLKIPIYFANPYSSWERGLNEHTNGLIRQYLPKKTDFNNVSKKEIEIIEKRLNTRPRKVLDYKTPEEVMFKTETYSPVALRM